MRNQNIKMANEYDWKLNRILIKKKKKLFATSVLLILHQSALAIFLIALKKSYSPFTIFSLEIRVLENF